MALKEKPRKGQRVAWRIDGKLQNHGTVRSVGESLCWCDFDDGTVNPFIWRFKRGLNELVEIVR